MNVRSHASRVSLTKLLPPPIPALLNTTSTWSLACAASSSSRNRRTCASSATSHSWLVTRTPAGAPSLAVAAVCATASVCTSHVATEDPCAASWRTSSRPMPEPPPVTTASFPANESIARDLPQVADAVLTKTDIIMLVQVQVPQEPADDDPGLQIGRAHV